MRKYLLPLTAVAVGLLVSLSLQASGMDALVAKLAGLGAVIAFVLVWWLRKARA